MAKFPARIKKSETSDDSNTRSKSKSDLDLSLSHPVNQSQTKDYKAQPSKNNWQGDFWGGLSAMLVALPSAVAFGILAFSGAGTEFIGQGVMAGLFGAAALGLVVPFIGRTKGLISAPCAPAAAVLSALVISQMATQSTRGGNPTAVISFLGLTCFLSALLQILYGLLRGGRLIKFIPYQVVTGYLSSVAVIIFLSQLPKFMGLAQGTSLAKAMTDFHFWNGPSIAIGLFTVLGMTLGPRLTQKLPAVILGLVSGIVSYFVISLWIPDLRVLEKNALVIGAIPMSGDLSTQFLKQVTSYVSISWSDIKEAIVPALTLSVLLSIDTLKTCVGIDAMTRSRHNSDRELIGQGLGNLLSSLIGGMPGAGTMGPTLVNISSGGNSPRAGVIEGVFVLAALLFLSPLISWVPIAALAGILITIAFRMIDPGVFKLLSHRSGRLDFLVIACVVIVALKVDLIAASGSGIVLSILLFIRDQVRGSVITQKTNLAKTSSKTIRQEPDRNLLRDHGAEATLVRLQGNLFFGTTDQLFTALELDLKTSKYLLFDFRRVQSIDYTAIHLFQQMHSQLKEKEGRLIFCELNAKPQEKKIIEEYLEQIGLLEEKDGILFAENTDSGLDWMEERLLSEYGSLKVIPEAGLELSDFNLVHDFDEYMIKLLRDSVREVSIAKNEKVFAQGDLGDEIFLVRRGQVRILLPLATGQSHHLATISAGGFFGELAFLDKETRSADVIALKNTDLYVLSRRQFNEHSRSMPEMGVQVFARLALVIAQRLRLADAELRIYSDL